MDVDKLAEELIELVGSAPSTDDEDKMKSIVVTGMRTLVEHPARGSSRAAIRLAL